MAQLFKKVRQNITDKSLLRLGACALIALSLNACSTLSMSDFGLGSDDKKAATTKTAEKTTPPSGPVALGNPSRPSVSSAKKEEEKGVWDRVTGWFGSKDAPKTAAVKSDNLAAKQISQANQTTAATNASLRAAQDVSKTQTTAPAKVATPQQSPVNLGKTTSPTTQAKIPNIQAPKVAQTQTTSPVQTTPSPQPQIAQKAPENKSFLDRVGSWFSSDKKKPASTAKKATPKSSINGLASAGQTTAPIGETEDAEALTPVQTLRLARQASKGTQASAQGLVPHVPNVTTQSPAQSADTLKTAATGKVKTSAPQKVVLRTNPKVTKQKVAVKPLTRSTTAPKRHIQVASANPAREKTEYVVTPESYRAAKAARSDSVSTSAPTPAPVQQTGKSDFSGAGGPSAGATKFYFGPGITNLAPHHIAQLKGIAGQALARQRQVVILGTSTPGGEAGSGSTKAGLQSLATARAMAAATNLQRFGVPGNMIKIKIAQSTTPSDIGTGGNSSFQALSARRVEVSLQ